MDSVKAPRRLVRAVTFGFALAAVLVVFGSFPFASGAGIESHSAVAAINGYPQKEADQTWSYQRFLASDRDSLSMLNRMGVDLGGSVEANPDGTIWATAVVTAPQRDYLAAHGYTPGYVIQTEADAQAAQAEMAETARREKSAMRAAKTGRPALHTLGRFGTLAVEALKVTRADYYRSLSGTWLSVETKSSAAQGNAAVPPGTPGCPATGGNRCGVYGGSQTGACWGNPAGGASALSTAACPLLNVAYSTDGGQTWQNGFQTQMSATVDDGVYLYHSLLVKLALKADDATAPHLPIVVRVASNYGTLATRDAKSFANTPPPYPSGFQRDFFTRYQTPEDGTAILQELHAQFPAITQLIPVAHKTNGYRRNSMAAMGCTPPSAGGNAQLPGVPGASPAGFATPATCTGSTVQAAAVVLNTWKYGQDDGDPSQNGNQVTVQFVNPGGTNQPLSVSTTGLAITVNLATDGTGALSSTAAQVVAALNADPSASAILWAATYRGNAGAGIVQPTAVVQLSDFLWAPQAGDATYPPGLQVPRAPYQQYVLRICNVCDGSKTGFFIYAQEHAREWVTPLVALETAERLLKNYGTDPQTTSFVNNLDIFIDPSINPDGANYSMLQGGGSGQRRTMTRYCGPNNPAGAGGDAASTSVDPASRGSWGVDANRNFSVGSLFDGYEGASSSCTSDVYAGPAELSEPETRNEVALEQTYPNIKFSMNIHSSGGYFMWSPASYKTVGREALPYPSKGWQEEFWAAAERTITAISNYRGTVITPDRTGSVVDVLYSAAGNSSDEAWYNRNIIAYDFEVGARQFSPTSTSNTGGDPGFTPNFAAEGRAEGQEFADGMYGLMASALDYEFDTTAPVVTTSVPSGTVSPDPISVTFDENEPSDTYYTTDGSTPTTSSTQYVLAGFREQEGATLTFTTDTVLKWFSVDPKGNTSSVHTAFFGVGDTKPVTTATLSPPAQNGWYPSPTLTLSATAGVGIAKIEYRLDGALAWTTYTGPVSGFTNGNHVVQYRATDNAGRVEDPQSLSFKVDAIKPTVEVMEPKNGAALQLGKPKKAKYKCGDKESGLATCVGTVANDANVDTSTVGGKTFSVTATDKAGNQTTKTVTYSVVYKWNGFNGPVTETAMKKLNRVHAGNLIKLEFGLDGNQGMSIGTFSSTAIPCPAWSAHPVNAAGPGTFPGLVFGGPGPGRYTYGWQTDSSWAGTCRRFSLALNDGTPAHTADFIFIP